MSERKWTPGPWTHHEKGIHPNPFVCGAEQDYEFGPDQPVVCYVVGMNTQANAHLIAAAPDLYEALQAMVDYCNAECGSKIYPGHQANVALAKARGETQ